MAPIPSRTSKHTRYRVIDTFYLKVFNQVIKAYTTITTDIRSLLIQRQNFHDYSRRSARTRQVTTYFKEENVTSARPKSRAETRSSR